MLATILITSALWATASLYILYRAAKLAELAQEELSEADARHKISGQHLAEAQALVVQANAKIKEAHRLRTEVLNELMRWCALSDKARIVRHPSQRACECAECELFRIVEILDES